MTWRVAKPVAALASAALLIQTGKNASEWDKCVTEDAANKNSQTEANQLEEKKKLARQAIARYMVNAGIPGLSVGVTINGKTVYTAGMGYADVETGGSCTKDTVMRIASISKPITATIAALLVDQGKLDINAPITKYLPEFPKKTVNGKTVDVTAKQLLSHTGGVRHYPEEPNEEKADLEAATNAKKKEFLMNDEFKSVEEALRIFDADPLVAEPGTKFSYTTHGFTLLSAVLEKSSGEKFPALAAALFDSLGMSHSSLDRNAPVTAGRARYYFRNKKHQLENCPEVNNSCKWAGGGIQSSVGDLLKFANAILYSHQCPPVAPPVRPLLSRSVIEQFWTGQIASYPAHRRVMAALGWFRVEAPVSVGGVRAPRTFWYHTGAGVGASSALLVAPAGSLNEDGTPNGVCVAILCNLQETSLLKLAVELKEIFEE